MHLKALKKSDKKKIWLIKSSILSAKNKKKQKGSKESKVVK